MEKQKAVVWGGGSCFNMARAEIYRDYDVLAVVDRNWENIRSDKKILAPEIIQRLEYDIVLICAYQETYPAIVEELKKLGIENYKHILPPQPSPFLIDPLFFKPQLTDCEKKQLFKNNVERVSLETSSRCNRFCKICPNSSIDRHSFNHMIDHNLFHKVLRELREIDYDCSMTFALFNEPLLDEELEWHIREVKSYIPKCTVYFNTNGDYLTREKWDCLAKAGLSTIRVTVYIDSCFEQEWTYEKALEAVDRKAKALGLTVDFYRPKDDRTAAAYGFNGFPFIIECADHRYRANRRAGTLETDLPIPVQEHRTDICKMIYQSFPLDYQGRVFPCVDMHPDHPALAQHFLGDLHDETIFDIWGGEKYRAFRANSILNPDFAECCASCSDYCDESINNTLPYLPFRDFVRWRNL